MRFQIIENQWFLISALSVIFPREGVWNEGRETISGPQIPVHPKTNLFQLIINPWQIHYVESSCMGGGIPVPLHQPATAFRNNDDNDEVDYSDNNTNGPADRQSPPPYATYPRLNREGHLLPQPIRITACSHRFGWRTFGIALVAWRSSSHPRALHWHGSGRLESLTCAHWLLGAELFRLWQFLWTGGSGAENCSLRPHL